MKDDIDRCLASFFRDAEESGLDVIVHIIDSSNNCDGVREMLEQKYPQVVYFNPGKNVGFGNGHNYAHKLVPAKYYLALNPDVELFPGTQSLKNLLDFFNKHNRVGIVAPKLLNLDDTLQFSCLRFPGLFDPIIRRLGLDKRFSYFKKRIDKYLMVDFDHNKTVAVDWVVGAFILMRDDLIQKIGLFDPRFFVYFEDCDLCRRVWEAGYQVYYDAEVMMKHRHRRESADGSQILAVFKNPTARVHIKSWLQYFGKWGVKNKHYGV
jgi:hypothetical protein